MKFHQFIYVAIFTGLVAVSCAKKTVPVSKAPTTPLAKDEKLIVLKTDSANYIIKRKNIKTTVPKVITVNDVAAKKTVDGRLYYDLNGKRYWRNKKDGKYYLYNKSMYNDPNFKP